MKKGRAQGSNPETGATRPAAVPLAAPARHRELFGWLADPEQMLAVFRRELPRLAQGEIRVESCKVRPSRTRKALRKESIHVVYTLKIHGPAGKKDCVLLGSAPETVAFLQTPACQALRGHPALAPFSQPAIFLEELQLALCFFPLDPGLPALAELTGEGGPRLLAPHLSECRAGAVIERIECELRHYKPFKRAVLRITVFFARPELPPRVVYAKLFRDDRGAAFQREQADLWSAARSARALRLPEPLGHDEGRGMLLMREAEGRPHLSDWISCLERGEPLPPDVDMGRVERGMAVVAEALAELQHSRVRPRIRRTFAGEIASMSKDRDMLRSGLAREHPELTARTEGLLGRLDALAPAREELAPAHGGFRHKQTIGDENTLTLIDWDGLCLADPALDAATFLLRLRWEPVCAPGSAPDMEHLAATFRRRFLALAKATPGRLALYEGLALVQEMLRCFRRAPKEQDMPGVIRNLALAAEAALDRVQDGHPL